MKRINLLCNYGSIIGFYFLCMFFGSCTSNNSKTSLVSKDSLPPQKDSVRIFEKILREKYNIKMVTIPPTWIVPSGSVPTFRKHFTEIFPAIGYKDVWVDKSVIWKAISEDDIDGFTITPICYPSAGTDGGVRHEQDELSFMITLTTLDKITGMHKADLNKAFDFNNPCPNYPNCP